MMIGVTSVLSNRIHINNVGISIQDETCRTIDDDLSGKNLPFLSITEIDVIMTIDQQSK